MAFSFRLQKLLDHREDQKKLAQEELARRQRELLQVEQELDRLQQEELKLLQLHRGKAMQKVDVYNLLAIDSYRIYLQERYRRKEKMLRKARQKVEEQRQEVLESWQRCQVLEKLREKALSDFLEEEKLKEQRLNDELTLYAYVRREGNGPEGGTE